MAEVGVALLSAFLGVLFDKMASREVVYFLRGRELTQGLLRKLKIAMLSVNSVLEDAEEKQHTKPIVKDWIYELKDALYDAEDVLDEIATEALLCKLDAEFQTTARKVRNSLSTLLNPSVTEGEPNIRVVLDRLEDLAKQKDFMGLQNEVGGKQSERLPSTSLVDVSGVLGRDKEKEKIIKFLLSDDKLKENEMNVVGIIGLGGLGKTTLARVIYNDQRVEEHFNGFKAWYSVSEEFHESNIMKSIIYAGNSSANDIKEPEILHRTLVETLNGKKFLLVLDDVRSIEPADRDFLRQLLKYGSQGSKVIITTREKDIAKAIHAVLIHLLKELKHDFCWLLFKKHAFRDSSSHVDPKLKKIGRQIVRRCGGLPLAVKAIGDLLWSETDVKKWKKILNNNLWDLEEAGINRPALSFSYKYLPSHLKRCFTYCSIFPKGYNFAKDQVILLWMAEGFLQASKSETMEEVGDCYFRALVSRSLFQKSSHSNSKFFMHDLVHDLAKMESRQFIFTMEVDNSYEITKMTRHMSYLCRSLDDSKKIEDEDLYRASQLRTFLALDSEPWDRKMKLSRLRCLRVLSLSHCKNIMELHDLVNKNKQLRYLDLSYTDIKRLPDSLCDLCNLQTLKLEFCELLTALPREMWKLSNLRHLDFAGTDIRKMPMQMDRLNCLQTLTKFIVGKHSGPRIRELGKLVNLRGKLHILELQNVESIEDAGRASLSKDRDQYLEELVLEWNASKKKRDISVSQRDVLDRLQPQTNLKSLTIKNYDGESFPDWIGDNSFSKISFLCLHNCEYCCRLPPLGQLPFLQELIIDGINGVVTVGSEFYGSITSSNSSVKPFEKLQVLKFKNMLKWEKWLPIFADNEDEGTGAFPKLKELHIEDSPNLRGELPLHLPSLAKLMITDCPNLDASASLPKAICGLLAGPPDLLDTGVAVVVTDGKIKRIRLEVSWQKYLRLEVRIFQQESLEEMINPNNNLLELSINGCPTLKSVSRNGGMPSSLKVLQIQNCGMFELPMHMQCSSLKQLELLNSCDSLVSFPLDRFPNLKCMSVDGCRNLESLTQHEGLEDLVIWNCPNLISFPKGGLTSTLKTLDIRGCKKLKLPMHLQYPSLHKFHLSDSCDSLVSFPLDLFPKLEEIRMHGCGNLESLTVSEQSDQHHDLVQISTMALGFCPKFVSFPKGGLCAPKLRLLWVDNCESLKSLPDKMHTLLTSLEDLLIEECRKIGSFPEEGLPSTLKVIKIYDCDKLIANRERWGLQKLPSLEKLEICGKSEDVKSFPGALWLLPTTLTELRIAGFPKMTSLDKERLQELTSLKKLWICDCDKIMYMPEGKLPESLSVLVISDCPLLEKQLQKRKGKEWLKIAHVTNVEIGGEVVQGTSQSHMSRFPFFYQFSEDCNLLYDWGYSVNSLDEDPNACTIM